MVYIDLDCYQVCSATIKHLKRMIIVIKMMMMMMMMLSTTRLMMMMLSTIIMMKKMMMIVILTPSSWLYRDVQRREGCMSAFLHI